VFEPVVMPADLADQKNGQLGPCVLVPHHFPGEGDMSLHKLAQQAFEALSFRLWVDTGGMAGGRVLSATGGGAYRSLMGQETAFYTRMTTAVTVYRMVNGEPVYITRTYKGQVFYLKPGFSPVAVPGTSNHGWGLAVDTAWFKGVGLPLAGIASDAKGWARLQDLAPVYGFSWEGARPGTPGWEPWHIRYVNGDNIPTAVQEFLAFKAANGKV
jgi:hypothetical protein